MIAIPDFESGAMENWGAITYRETAILIDEEHSSLSNKQWVSLVIAHELAHQWFGNLVTMHWWTDLWLNEGFASYIEYLAIDHVFPEWKIWDQFLTSDFSAALRLDSLSNSHPVEVEVHHPNEINEIFDSISYSKGSSIIRMLASYIGEDNFKLGLQHYLKKHSYKNTKTIDLWGSFEKVSKKPVRKIMHNWASKTGYPIVTIEKKLVNYKITQGRFFSSRVSKKKSKESTTWQIPFIYESDKKIKKELISKKIITLKEKNIGKANKGEQSLVRVKYDNDTLLKLKEKIELGELSISDRLGIIRDLFALAEGGYIKTHEVLEFSLAYKNEKEYAVWAEIAMGIDKVANIIGGEKFLDKYNKYALSIFEPLAEKIGWQKKSGEDSNMTFLRSLILSHAGFYGSKKIIKDAQLKWKNRKLESIDSDVRSVVYTIVARNGNSVDWEEMKKSYESTEMQEEKNRYLSALAQFKDKNLINKTLVYVMSDKVRNQDAPHIINAVWGNSVARDIVWKFIKKNWKTILKTYGEGGHFLSRLLPRLGSHTNTKDAVDAKKFFKKHGAPGAERTLEQAYERIYSNSAWLASDKKGIEQWLKENFS
jgi:puromycin-sensitive aminopeptidase